MQNGQKKSTRSRVDQVTSDGSGICDMLNVCV